MRPFRSSVDDTPNKGEGPASISEARARRSPDVLVVGAGPAGLCCAIACALQELSVTVLEREAQLPIDRACGEGLMPDAVRALAQLGVEPDGCEISGIRYADDRHSVVGSFDRAHGGLGLGVRRTELSRSLRERALELGVQLCTGDAFEALATLPEDRGWSLQSTSGQWTPRVIVGADGGRSNVRAAAGLDTSGAVVQQENRVGIRRHFVARDEINVAEDQVDRSGSQHTHHSSLPVEVFWTEGAEAYLTPVGEGVFGLAFLFSSQQGRSADDGGGPVFDQLLAKFPELQQRVACAEPTTRARGAGPLRQHARALVRDNVALIGDAGGYVDAITGEGMAIAFAEAMLLAESLSRLRATVDQGAAAVGQSLARYESKARKRRRLPDTLTSGALKLSRRPWLRRRFLAALARKPALFDRLLALHARALPDRAAVPLAAVLGVRMLLPARAQRASSAARKAG